MPLPSWYGDEPSMFGFYFMEIIIKSKKYGERKVIIDDADYDLVKHKKWRLLVQPHSYTEYAIANSNTVKPYYTIRMHVLIMGAKKGFVVDHKDRNGLNNTRNNLRHCTQSQNTCNRMLQSNNTTGYNGVFFVKSSNKNQYWAYIWVNKKRIGGGMYGTAIEAAVKYNEMAIKYHGEFAKMNKI